MTVHPLLLAAALVLAGLTGYALRGRRARDTTYEEGLDFGIQHGIDLAHRAVTGYRKPWITLTQEQGWDRARGELAAAIDELRTPADLEPTP